MKRKILFGIICITVVIGLVGCAYKQSTPQADGDAPANIGATVSEELDDIPQAVDDTMQTKEDAMIDKGDAPQLSSVDDMETDQ